jgi:hypothetical protein
MLAKIVPMQSSAVLIFILCLYVNLFCSSVVICILCNTKELDSKGDCARIQLRVYEPIAARLKVCNNAEVWHEIWRLWTIIIFSIKTDIFWVVTPCSLVKCNQSFGDIYHTYLQVRIRIQRHRFVSCWQHIQRRINEVGDNVLARYI